jgi:hypothetical protein
MRRWIGALACALLLAGTHAAGAPPHRPHETKERRDDDALKQQLAIPLLAAAAGDMARADREFESIFAAVQAKRGALSLQAADIISAFGVELFNIDRRAEASIYLKRAIGAYRLATDPDNPEVAVADHDYANAELKRDPDVASADVVEAVRDALRIRRKAFGERNAETAVTYVLLGRVTGNPVLTQRDPQKIEAAADLIRHGAALLPQTAGAKPNDVSDAAFRVAELYARNGRGPQTVVAVANYWTVAGRQGLLEAGLREGRTAELADTLSEHGQTKAAQTLRDNYHDTKSLRRLTRRISVQLAKKQRSSR